MNYDFDIIVVGSGAGGGTLAAECATLGKSVLIIERGPAKWHEETAPAKLSLVDEQSMLIEKRPYDDRPIQINGDLHRLYMGGVMGGGTSLYGAVLLRPSTADFHPGQSYGARIPREIWDWPISYDDLKPHYDRAEQLYRLRYSLGEDYGPLNSPCEQTEAELLPLMPINQRLIEKNRSRGLAPFRLPLAIDTAQCLRCNACPGYVCPSGARRSSRHLINEAIAKQKTITVLDNTEVERLTFDNKGRVSKIHATNRLTRKPRVLRAKRYALSAGAIGSPGILLKSGVTHSQLGRNYMMHLSPIAAGLFPGRTHGEDRFIKQVGFWDYYHGTKPCPHKMGLIQSIPVPGKLMLAKSGLKRFPNAVIHSLRKRMLPLCGIIEDLPNPNNRVMVERNGELSLKHQFSAFDKERGSHLQKEMCRILNRAGAIWCVKREIPSQEHVAHQCGTLRFGTNPRYALADAECRMFFSENLFIADGSIFPTSLGVGPALTIMANALRVAGILAKEV